MIDYAAILIRHYPGTVWSLNGDDYDGLTWLCEAAKPSRKELDALWPQVQSEITKESRDTARRAAYMVESDPVFFKWQRGEATEQDWLDAVAAVKAKHPA